MPRELPSGRGSCTRAGATMALVMQQTPLVMELGGRTLGRMEQEQAGKGALLLALRARVLYGDAVGDRRGLAAWLAPLVGASRVSRHVTDGLARLTWASATSTPTAPAGGQSADNSRDALCGVAWSSSGTSAHHPGLCTARRSRRGGGLGGPAASAQATVQSSRTGSVMQLFLVLSLPLCAGVAAVAHAAARPAASAAAAFVACSFRRAGAAPHARLRTGASTDSDLTTLVGGDGTPLHGNPTVSCFHSMSSVGAPCTPSTFVARLPVLRHAPQQKAHVDAAGAVPAMDSGLTTLVDGDGTPLRGVLTVSCFHSTSSVGAPCTPSTSAIWPPSLASPFAGDCTHARAAVAPHALSAAAIAGARTCSRPRPSVGRAA